MANSIAPLSPSQFLHQEMLNPLSRLCGKHGLVRDVALNILDPMLLSNFRSGYTPGVFTLNNKSFVLAEDRWVKLEEPSLITRFEVTENKSPSSKVALVIDRMGRHLLVNHAGNCLTIVSQDGTNSTVATMPKGADESAHLVEPVIDSSGRIYVLSENKTCFEVYSSEGKFEKTIDPKEASPNEHMGKITSLTIDHKDNLFFLTLTQNKEAGGEIFNYFTIKKYDLKNTTMKKIFSVSLHTTYKDFSILPNLDPTQAWRGVQSPHIKVTFDPFTNRLYMLRTRGLEYLCCSKNRFEDLLKIDIRKERGRRFENIIVDALGNLYISDQKKISIYNQHGLLLSNLALSSSHSNFALNSSGNLSLYDPHRGIITYNDESSGELLGKKTVRSLKKYDD